MSWHFRSTPAGTDEHRQKGRIHPWNQDVSLRQRRFFSHVNPLRKRSKVLYNVPNLKTPLSFSSKYESPVILLLESSVSFLRPPSKQKAVGETAATSSAGAGAVGVGTALVAPAFTPTIAVKR